MYDRRGSGFSTDLELTGKDGSGKDEAAGADLRTSCKKSDTTESSLGRVETSDATNKAEKFQISSLDNKIEQVPRITLTKALKVNLLRLNQ